MQDEIALLSENGCRRREFSFSQVNLLQRWREFYLACQSCPNML